MLLMLAGAGQVRTGRETFLRGRGTRRIRPAAEGFRGQISRLAGRRRSKLTPTAGSGDAVSEKFYFSAQPEYVQISFYLPAF